MLWRIQQEEKYLICLSNQECLQVILLKTFLYQERQSQDIFLF